MVPYYGEVTAKNTVIRNHRPGLFVERIPSYNYANDFINFRVSNSVLLDQNIHDHE